MLRGKSLLVYTNLFSTNDYGNKNKIILKYFHCLKLWRSYFVLFVVSIENLKNLKISYLLDKIFFFLLLATIVKIEKN